MQVIIIPEIKLKILVDSAWRKAGPSCARGAWRSFLWWSFTESCARWDEKIFGYSFHWEILWMNIRFKFQMLEHFKIRNLVIKILDETSQKFLNQEFSESTWQLEKTTFLWNSLIVQVAIIQFPLYCKSSYTRSQRQEVDEGKLTIEHC